MLKLCKRLLYVVLYFNFCLLQAQTPIDLSFKQLPQLTSTTPESIHSLQNELAVFHRQLVKIRGFLYCNPAGQWILAAEPNLKTCCQGASGKVFQQLFLSKPDFIDISMHAITLQGILVIDPIWIENDSSRQLQQIYRLNSPVIINTSNSWVNYLILVSLLITLCLTMYLYRSILKNITSFLQAGWDFVRASLKVGTTF